MTTVLTPRQASKRPVRFWRATLAEWTKFRTVRSSVWTLLIAATFSVALGVVFLNVTLDGYDRMNPAEQAANDPVAAGAIYTGLRIGQIVVAILGVIVAASEYSTGTIRATLAAVPSRMRAFSAKTVSFAAVALIAGGVQATAMFVIAVPILAAHSLDLSLTDSTELRKVALAGLSTMGVGLLGLGFGMLIRHTAGAISAVVGVLLVIPFFVEPLFPSGWKDDVPKFLPGNAAWAMYGGPAHEGEVLLAQGPATAVFLGYVTLLLASAAMLFARRDA